MVKILKQFIKTTLQEFLNENTQYDSFSNLTEKDLYDIAKWGLFDGGYMLYDELGNEDAIEEIVNDFKSLLNSNYPDGFKNIPNVLTLYRIVKLNNPKELNRENLGRSWFSNKERIRDKNFLDQLFNSSKNLHIITAEVPLSKVDIPRSLIQRVTTYIENEIVLNDDTNIKIISLDEIS